MKVQKRTVAHLTGGVSFTSVWEDLDEVYAEMEELIEDFGVKSLNKFSLLTESGSRIFLHPPHILALEFESREVAD